MLEDIKTDFESVLQQEKNLQFDHFSHSDALDIVKHIVKRVEENDTKPVTICIVYEGTVIANYLMDGRKPSEWVNRKIKTVSESLHSSLYVFLQAQAGIAFQDWKEDSTYAVCGGGFPIIENGDFKGVAVVSGLEHFNDHKLLVEAFQVVKNKKK